MPDMRDAIAQYLAFQGGAQGMMAPRPGIPSNLQGYPQLPSGQFLPTPISDTGPMPGVQQMPTSPDYTGPQGTNAPPVPSNLQGFQQLPSGQFMPNQPLPNDGGPGGNWPSGPGGNWPMPPVGPGTGPPMPGPGVTPPMEPPVNTPMQAPADPFGGMDPQEWYRTYWGGMGR